MVLGSDWSLYPSCTGLRPYSVLLEKSVLFLQVKQQILLAGNEMINNNWPVLFL